MSVSWMWTRTCSAGRPMAVVLSVGLSPCWIARSLSGNAATGSKVVSGSRDRTPTRMVWAVPVSGAAVSICQVPPTRSASSPKATGSPTSRTANTWGSMRVNGAGQCVELGSIFLHGLRRERIRRLEQVLQIPRADPNDHDPQPFCPGSDSPSPTPSSRYRIAVRAKSPAIHQPVAVGSENAFVMPAAGRSCLAHARRAPHASHDLPLHEQGVDSRRAVR